MASKPSIFAPSATAAANASPCRTKTSLTDGPGLLIVYDATPCHSGMRWGILVEETGKSEALTARVVLLCEKALQAAAKNPWPATWPLRIRVFGTDGSFRRSYVRAPPFNGRLTSLP
jgi:hypothetical protein